MPSVIKYAPNVTINCPVGAADIAEGALVGLTSSSPALLVGVTRNAAQSATVANEAIGFAVRAAKAGAMCAVAPICTVGGFSGLTPGTRVYSSATIGGVSQTRTSTNGEIFQVVGRARTTTEVDAKVGDGFLIAATATTIYTQI